TFSPDGKHVAFVRDNNIFVKDLEKGTEIQVTKDGKKNAIINGATDWVYEEEFAFDKAFFWSAEGSKIAYYRFDETAVPEFSMDVFKGGLYPEQEQFKYPKAGEANATVGIFVYNLRTNNTAEADIKANDEFYIPRIKWTKDDNLLSVQRMNRHQNELDFILVNGNDGASNVIFTEKDAAYVDVSDDLTFLNNGKQFVWTSEKSGFNHVYLYDLRGKQVRQITKGNWDVTSVYGVDVVNNLLYYQSAEESPLRRSVYVIDLKGRNKRRLSIKEGTNKAYFSKNFSVFINNYSNANSPSEYTLHLNNGKLARELVNNEKLKETLEGLSISPKEFFTFKTSEDVELNGWMIKPADFDATKKYPVFMTVYGGPGSQTVTDSWGGSNYFWHEMMAQEGYIVVSVDNRGTGARGRDFKKITYQELGKYETIDQIEAAKYLGGLDYVDADRIGIQGWSYGGYMSSLCLTKGAEQFKAAIAVAPVTTWRYYDSIYTERYMRTPQENEAGYDDNSPINHVDKMEGAYLLVHGSADDNVHYQNTMEMITALVKANKQFDLFIYPDNNHGIYFGNSRLHLYTKMTNFLKENL
ncbi:MAG: dipeptidyl-peptidase-4, partial [Candidatus Azotimanducaceae bacterium]